MCKRTETKIDYFLYHTIDKSSDKLNYYAITYIQCCIYSNRIRRKKPWLYRPSSISTKVYNISSLYLYPTYEPKNLPYLSSEPNSINHCTNISNM